MNKDEILERNKRSNPNEDDEMEQYINGKAGLNAKLVFSILILALAILKYCKNLPTGDMWTIFMAYVATESLYKYYYLRDKKLLFCGILFSISGMCFLSQFIILTYK